MKLSIIICVYNEIKTIKEILNRVSSVKLNFKITKEIIVIDDNSTDGTKEYLQEIHKDEFLKVLFNSKNLGKGYSLKKGIKTAQGDLIIFQDADLEYNPTDYNKLINRLIEDELDFVFGSRILNNEKYHRYTMHKYVVIFFSKFINLFLNTNFTDTATNYKLFKSNIIKEIELISNGFAIDFEITVKLAKKKFNFGEVPIDYTPREYKDGKKIGFLDGIKCLVTIIYFIFFKK